MPKPVAPPGQPVMAPPRLTAIHDSAPRRSPAGYGDNSEHRVEQRIGHIEKRGLTECRHVGAIRNQKEAEDQKPLGNAGKARRVVFHRILLDSLNVLTRIPSRFFRDAGDCCVLPVTTRRFRATLLNQEGDFLPAPLLSRGGWRLGRRVVLNRRRSEIDATSFLRRTL